MWSTSTYLIDHNQFIIFTMFLSSCATLTPPPTCKKKYKTISFKWKGVSLFELPNFSFRKSHGFFFQPKDLLGDLLQAFRCKRKQNLHSNLLPNCWVNDGELKLPWGSNPWTKKIYQLNRSKPWTEKTQPISPTTNREAPRTFDETFQLLVGTKKKGWKWWRFSKIGSLKMVSS